MDSRVVFMCAMLPAECVDAVTVKLIPEAW
jgi:hypothetical protein